MFTVYFLADLPRIQRGAALLFPRAHRVQFSRIADVVVDKVGSYMIGNILISLVTGLAAVAPSPRSGYRSPCYWPSWSLAVTDLIPMVCDARRSDLRNGGAVRHPAPAPSAT